MSDEFNEALEVIEDYITVNGVPRCDYARYRQGNMTPKQRLRAGVHKLISILKHDNAQQMKFKEWINVLQPDEKPPGQFGFNR